MLPKSLSIFAVTALSVLQIATAQAADKTEIVKFKPGASSATIKGVVKGYDMNTYVLGANAGQTLSVTFKQSNTSCYYNVEAAGVDEALFNGSMSTGDFSGALPATGKYQVKVYLMRNAARRDESCRFSLKAEIRD